MHELFQYRQRERRAPLEDFLTTAFIGFARTLPRAYQFALAAELFVAPSERQVFVEACSRSLEHRWDTQFILPNVKRPDIVFWLDGTPAVVIENKIWSGIAVHHLADADGADEQSAGDVAEPAEATPVEITQLATYGHWLRDARVGTGWLGSIALLTHGTPKPHDFHSLSGAYGAVPHTCRWSAVHLWLRNFLSQHPGRSDEQQSASAFLATELAAFLKKKGLVMPVLKFSDIDALGNHLASKSSLNSAFQEILATVRATFTDLTKDENARAIKYESAYGVVQGWAYLAQQGLPDRTFFGWGIRFPHASSWWEGLRDQLPEENHVFAYLGSDATGFPAKDIPTGIRPPGWMISADGMELIAAAPLSALPSADTLSQALALWVTDQLTALVPSLDHLSQT